MTMTRRTSVLRLKQRWLAALVLGLAGSTLAACGGNADEPATAPSEPSGDEEASATDGEPAADEPIRIGIALAETGPLAATDASYLTGAQAAIEWINENGGILDGRQLEAVVRDTAGDATQASTVARELVGDEDLAFLVIDPVSSVALAQAPVANEAGIPTIAMAATADIADPAQNPWIFSFGDSSVQTARQALNYLVDVRGFTDLGVLYENNPFGQGQLADTQQEIGDYGAELVASEGFQTGATDVTAQLRALENAGSEAVLLWTYGPGQAAALQGFQTMGWSPPTVSTPGLALPVIAEAIGGRENMENVYGYGPGKSMLREGEAGTPSPEAVPYLESLPDGYDGDIIMPSWMFDAVRTFAEAIEQAGSTDPEAIREVLESGVEFEGVRTNYSFSPESHLGVNLDYVSMFDASQPCSIEAGCVAAPDALSP